MTYILSRTSNDLMSLDPCCLVETLSLQTPTATEAGMWTWAVTVLPSTRWVRASHRLESLVNSRFGVIGKYISVFFPSSGRGPGFDYDLWWKMKKIKWACYDLCNANEERSREGHRNNSKTIQYYSRDQMLNHSSLLSPPFSIHKVAFPC